ncbi:hypothetical protein LTR36_007169 [Oleoguttula mirabilis]|uniref:C2H2-type domain-containing protein n=1 Tax=Oleoguttula mirabilis TaxID=1507867 RepID=A0AAV9JAZ4_9PEZI|nr:hypothetical protein LTR36_007169 [Oleoguttula mirabilis]
MSSFIYQQFFPHNHPDPRAAYYYEQSALPTGDPYHFSDASIISDALALLQQPANLCVSNEHFNPNISIQHTIPTPLPLGLDTRQDSILSCDTAAASQTWMYQPSMGGPAIQHTQGLKRARSHQRTPSASTIASTGPASPYQQIWTHPQIANTDFAPNSPAQFADQAGTGAFSKALPTSAQTPTDGGFIGAGYIPSQAAHTGGAHQAMKGFAIDHHIGEDFAPGFIHSARQSMSSHSNDSPATPPSGAGETGQTAQYNLPPNGETSAEKTEDEGDYLLFGADFRQPNPNVQLFRTESQAYQDELYNPPTTTYSPTPASATKAANMFLSPHSNVMTERLNTANIARSHTPTSGMSRERSPFRDGSPLAPTGGWQSPAPTVGTAASMRQHQKEQADQAELAQHQPQLRREPTKTISPKDALLDYNEPEQPSLFQDTIPAGYKQHNGGVEQWQNNTFISTPGAAFGSLTTPSQQPFTNFRATSADGYAGGDAMAYVPLPPNPEGQGRVSLQNGSYFANSYAAPKMGSHLDTNPEFPAHLTSMESSTSDHGAPQSSQDSAAAATSMLQRPADTRAGTGTYTCTYHGCIQRFDSHANLQKHKRDTHRSAHQRDNSGGGTSSGTASKSPGSTESPEPTLDTDGMTSAALMARNSQAGPHKCSRINPSTNKPCNTIFSRPYDLTRHEDTIHNNRKMKVRCPMCREEKTFSRNDALTRHMRVVHPEVETFGKRGKRGE